MLCCDNLFNLGADCDGTIGGLQNLNIYVVPACQIASFTYDVNRPNVVTAITMKVDANSVAYPWNMFYVAANFSNYTNTLTVGDSNYDQVSFSFRVKNQSPEAGELWNALKRTDVVIIAKVSGEYWRVLGTNAKGLSVEAATEQSGAATGDFAGLEFTFSNGYAKAPYFIDPADNVTIEVKDTLGTTTTVTLD